MKKLTAVVLLLASVALLCAQEVGQDSGGSFGVVIYADGDVVSIIRDGRRFDYDAFTGELLGLPIFGGDIIQTDPGTYLEIQLLPSQSVVKVAENTSFSVQRISRGGEGVLDLAYGRLRARVDRLTSNEPFEIRGLGTVAGVRGTDFGTDVIITPRGGETLTRIYCFEGEIEVTTEEPAPLPDPAETESLARVVDREPILVAANQMVTATRTVRPPAELGAAPADERQQTEAREIGSLQFIEPEIQEFWQREDFVAEAKELDEVFADFPFLEDDAKRRLGTVPFLESAAPRGESTIATEPEPAEEPAAVTVVEVDPDTDQPEAAEAVQLTGGSQTVDPERQRRLIGATRATGITLATIGLLADAAAVTAYFWGDQLLPGFPPANNQQTIVSVGAAGGVFLIGGILALLFSVQLAN